MGDLLEPLFVLTVLVYGVVIYLCVRNWYRRKSAAIDAGIKQVLDPTDPQMEARIANQDRKCS